MEPLDSAIRLFQFHSGTIRSDAGRVYSAGNGKFQFHSGTIRSPLRRPADAIQKLFQFHSGTIRSGLFESGLSTLVRFQFHSGTIRSLFSTFLRKFRQNFNSTQVRLEVFAEDVATRLVPDFNSTQVRLEALPDFELASFFHISIPLRYD